MQDLKKAKNKKLTFELINYPIQYIIQSGNNNHIEIDTGVEITYYQKQNNSAS